VSQFLDLSNAHAVGLAQGITSTDWTCLLGTDIFECLQCRSCLELDVKLMVDCWSQVGQGVQDEYIQAHWRFDTLDEHHCVALEDSHH